MFDILNAVTHCVLYAVCTAHRLQYDPTPANTQIYRYRYAKSIDACNILACNALDQC